MPVVRIRSRGRVYVAVEEDSLGVVSVGDDLSRVLEDVMHYAAGQGGARIILDGRFKAHSTVRVPSVETPGDPEAFVVEGPAFIEFTGAAATEYQGEVKVLDPTTGDYVYTLASRLPFLSLRGERRLVVRDLNVKMHSMTTFLYAREPIHEYTIQNGAFERLVFHLYGTSDVTVFDLEADFRTSFRDVVIGGLGDNSIGFYLKGTNYSQGQPVASGHENGWATLDSVNVSRATEAAIGVLLRGLSGAGVRWRRRGDRILGLRGFGPEQYTFQTGYAVHLDAVDNTVIQGLALADRLALLIDGLSDNIEVHGTTLPVDVKTSGYVRLVGGNYGTVTVDGGALTVEGARIRLLDLNAGSATGTAYLEAMNYNYDQATTDLQVPPAGATVVASIRGASNNVASPAEPAAGAPGSRDSPLLHTTFTLVLTIPAGTPAPEEYWFRVYHVLSDTGRAVLWTDRTNITQYPRPYEVYYVRDDAPGAILFGVRLHETPQSDLSIALRVHLA